jgi:hypothetical protein
MERMVVSDMLSFRLDLRKTNSILVWQAQSRFGVRAAKVDPEDKWKYYLNQPPETRLTHAAI